jgi:hypothetical protein
MPSHQLVGAALISAGIIVSGGYATIAGAAPSRWGKRFLPGRPQLRPTSTDELAKIIAPLAVMSLALPVYALLRAGEAIYRACDRRLQLSPPAPVPAGWYTDPLRAHILRWWSGTEWTPHTSDESLVRPTPTDPGTDRHPLSLTGNRESASDR